MAYIINEILKDALTSGMSWSRSPSEFFSNSVLCPLSICSIVRRSLRFCDKVNRKQFFPLANFLGSLLCYSCSRDNCTGLSFLCLQHREVQEVDQLAVYYPQWLLLLEHWGQLGQHKNSTGLCLLSKLPVIGPNPIQLRKWQLLLWKLSHNFYLFAIIDTKCLLVGLVLEACHFNGRICQSGWHRLGELVALW